MVRCPDGAFAMLRLTAIQIRFNYRATQKLVESGSYEFWNWFDDFSWSVPGGSLRRAV